MKTNAEIASEFLSAVVANQTALEELGRRVLATYSRIFRKSTPRELREHARGFAARASREARVDSIRGRIYAALSAVFALAAEPNQKGIPPSCCRANHPGRMSRGPGDRRSDCARFSACLGAFARASPREETAHCPEECGAFVELRRRTGTHRATNLSARASVAGDGRSGTGIY